MISPGVASLMAAEQFAAAQFVQVRHILRMSRPSRGRLLLPGVVDMPAGARPAGIPYSGTVHYPDGAKSRFVRRCDRRPKAEATACHRQLDNPPQTFSVLGGFFRLCGSVPEIRSDCRLAACTGPCRLSGDPRLFSKAASGNLAVVQGRFLVGFGCHGRARRPDRIPCGRFLFWDGAISGQN